MKNNSQKSEISEEIGHIFGPSILNFVKSINKYAKENNYKKIFFAQRDMNIIKQIYDQLYSDKNIQTSYIYISRKCVLRSLKGKKVPLEKIAKIIPNKKMSCKTFAQILGFEYDNELISTKEALLTNKDFINKYNDDIESNYESYNYQYNLMIKYFDQIGFDSNSLLVDFGWSGSIEYMLKEMLGKTKINSLYYGLRRDNLLDKNGVFFGKNLNVGLGEKIISFTSVFESLFMPEFGSCVGYEEKEKKITPILNDKGIVKNEKVAEIQNNIIAYCIENKNIDISNRKVLKKVAKLATTPKIKYIDYISNFEFEDYNVEPLCSALPGYYLFSCPKKFLKSFIRSQWKCAFLKKAFRIKLPYFSIYKFLLRIRDKKNG